MAKKRGATGKKRNTSKKQQTTVTIDGFVVKPKTSSKKTSAAKPKNPKVTREINDIKTEIKRLESIEKQKLEAPEEAPKEPEEVPEESIADETIDFAIDEAPKTSKSAKKTGVVSKIFRTVLVLAEFVAAIVFLVGLFRFNVLSLWQNLLISAVVVLLFAFTARKLLKRHAKKVTRITCGILAVFLTIVYGAGFYYISHLVTFVENITADNTEKQNYSVAVLKDASYGEISDIKDKTVGFQKNNLHLDAVKEKLSSTISYNSKDYDDLANMFIDLQSTSTSAIVLVSSNVDIMKEDAKEYYEQIKIIYTFDIEIEKEEEAVSNKDLSSEPFIVYISGTDSRGTVADTARSDVNMVAVVNPGQGKILLVSIPRDYYVQLHGTTGTKDKLTHAGMYGINMSKNTVADLFGIKIDHTVKVSFSTVERLVDAIDGIDINSDASFRAWTDKGCYIQKGVNHLNGRCALAYARERYAYASGDRHRIQNQQEVLRAVFKKATGVRYLVNYPTILSVMDGTFQTSFTYDQITAFARMQLNTLRSWEIESISVDGSGSLSSTYSMGSQPLYVMIPNQDTINAAKEKIAEYLKTE